MMDQNHDVKGVVFETDSYKAIKFYNETNTPKMVKLVVKYSHGLIKDEKQANYLLLGFAILAFVVSLFLFFGGRGNEASQKPSPEMLEQMKLMNPVRNQ